MFHRLVNFFSSLRLTVVCLSCALLLVFIGTLAQVKLGLYTAQSEFFRSVFVYWQPNGTHFRIPVFPGGWLLGGVLLINLLAAHTKRFEISRKKIGIFLIHGGLIFLLLGQFFTEIFQVESAMRLEEGETKTYSEDFRKNELVVIETSNPNSDKIVSIPESFLAREKEIQPPNLPFTLRVKNYWVNSDLTRQAEPGSVPSSATHGLGTNIFVLPQAAVTSMDLRNLPSAVVEVVTPKGTLGTWLVSSLSGAKQTFTYDGKDYQIAMRFLRYYNPFAISLLEFKHEIYKGTDIPKNFASRIHLRNASNGDDRDVLIYMNNPLRYAGLTFFQAGFDEKNAHVTILQVVQNPASITPYVACSLMGAGLLTQFLMSLFTFFKRRRAQMKTPILPGKERPTSRKNLEPALAQNEKGNRRRNS